MCCVLPGLAASQEPEQFESLLASAQQALARGDFQSAADFYKEAVQLHPENAELRTNLGLMYYQTGEDDKAIQALVHAIRLKQSLFVPNLFLGLEYVKQKQFGAAIPYLKRAAHMKPNDAQIQLALGEAYAASGNSRLAITAYLQAKQIDSANAGIYYHLGVAYLEQVEADARILLTRHKGSGYVQALVADTFADQRAFIQAADAYKKALSLGSFPPGTHANYGFALLNKHDFGTAEQELKAELVLNPGSLMAKLGLARLHTEQGATEQAVKEIQEVGKTDPGFLRANVGRFNVGLSEQKRSELQRALEERQQAAEVSEEVVAFFRNGDTERSPAQLPTSPTSNIEVDSAEIKGPVAGARELYGNGKYKQCRDVLASRFVTLQTKDVKLLAVCANLAGDNATAFRAANRLAGNPATETEGLYWETKSAQELAGQALTRASALDSNSPKLHVLLGDVYRQRKNFPDAEQEYRKALTLRPQDTGALFGLSLALLANGQTDEALHLAQTALGENPDDPELNAVMGEILCARSDFTGAEAYLKKSLNTKPEYISHVHALLGKVYAQTNRTQQAIAELKLALADDKDGHVHYQIARLYLKIGNQDAAKQAFDVSARIRRAGLTRAAVAMQQGGDESEPQ
jgi:tetratricopeptide (TPR) repeat protein